MKNISNIIVQKFFSIISFSLLTLVLIIIQTTPKSTGTELSIYNAYPIYFWITFISIFIIAIIFSFNQILQKNNKLTNFIFLWVPAILGYFILLLLPYLRGYFYYGRGDALTHLGYVKDIIYSGTILENGYPISHILTSIISLICQIELNIVILFLPAFFIILYILFMNILGKTIFKKSWIILLFTIFALFLNLIRVQEFAPFHFASLYFPLFLYLFYKAKSNISFSILLIVVIIFMPFLHIFFYILTIITVLIFIVSERQIKFFSEFLSKMKIFQIKLTTNTGDSKRLIIFILMITTGIIWSVQTYYYSIRSFFSWFLKDAGKETILSSTLNTLDHAGLTIQEFLYTLWFRMSNQLFFYVAPIILSIILFFIIHKTKRKIDIDKNFINFTTYYIIFIVLSILFLFTKGMFSYARLFVFMGVFSAVVCCKLISQIIQKSGKIKKNIRSAGALIFIFILCVVMITTIITIHSSPINNKGTSQVTNMDYIGASWNLEKLQPIGRVDVRVNLLNFMRFNHAINGETAQLSFKHPFEGIPDEFGYDENENIKKSFNISNQEEVYMIFTKLDQIQYQIYFERLWDKALSYSDENIYNLKNDFTANNLYSNGEFTTHLIK